MNSIVNFFYILRKISHPMPNSFVIVNKVLKNETLEKNLGPLKKDEICGKVFMKKKLLHHLLLSFKQFEIFPHWFYLYFSWLIQQGRMLAGESFHEILVIIFFCQHATGKFHT